MATVVTRLYADWATAHAVVAELEHRGFGGVDFSVIGLPEAPAASAPIAHDGGDEAATASPAPKRTASPEVRDRLAGEMKAAGVLADTAGGYLDHVADGNVLVVVRAPFGFASTAREVVDSFGPLDVSVPRADVHVRALGAGVHTGSVVSPLINSNTFFLTGPIMEGVIKAKTPLSSLFGLPVLIKPGKGARLLSPESTPLSSLFHIPLLKSSKTKTKLLSDNSTPLSSMLGLPLLTKRREPKSA